MGGTINGSSWHSSHLPMQSVMLQLQSPTVTITDADLDVNSLFNTGISTQLSPSVAMAIHGIRWNFALSTYVTPGDFINQIIALITEDVGATDAGAELTDPRTLAEAGTQSDESTATAVGESHSHSSVFFGAEFDPPIWTVAQRLNLVAIGIEQAGGAMPEWDIHAKIAYTVEPVDTQMSTRLVQRLNLATQP